MLVIVLLPFKFGHLEPFNYMFDDRPFF